MAITAAQVKELRDMTGISMMECKKALVESDGDVEKAVELLRKKGLAKAAKNADREANEGAIKIDVEGGKAYVIAVACETDFVAINDDFGAMLASMIDVLKKTGNTSAEELEAIRTENVLKMGENLVIKASEIIEGDNLGTYVHSNRKVAAVLSGNASEENLKQIAMHVSATKPSYLSPDHVEAEVVAKEKEIAMEQMKNDPKMEGKPEQVLEKILEGKIAKFKSENALLTQDFVIDPNQKVGDFAGKDGVKAFKLFTI